MHDMGGQTMISVHIEEFESYADLEDYLKTVEYDDEMAKLHSQLMDTLDAGAIERFTCKGLFKDYARANKPLNALMCTLLHVSSLGSLTLHFLLNFCSIFNKEFLHFTG
jgi:hypothetical protein